MEITKIENDSFDLIRNSNQNTFIEMKHDIDSNKSISEPQLYEKWITSFIENTNLNLEKYELEFQIVNNEPEVILVKVNGYSDSIYLSEPIISEVVSGVLVEDY